MSFPELPLLYVDAALIVAEKPAGLRSQPAGGSARSDSLLTRLRVRFPDVELAHRLDQATSGLIVLARGPDMLRRMNAAFSGRTVGKRYVALAHGHLAEDVGEIDLPIGPIPNGNPRQQIDRIHGRRALTRYRVIARSGAGPEALTRIELAPLTGRTHQLRVHLQALGHPLLGDPLYAEPNLAAGRLHLHAAELSFIHPERRTPVQFSSLPPF